MPRVNTEVLRWAREAAGLSRDEAAQRLGLKDGKRSTAVEQLDALEGGAKEPSRPQLLRFSSTYRRPLITFYLAAPPPKARQIEDFRTLPMAPPARIEANLDALLRDVRARQELVRDVLEEEEAPRVKWVGSAHRRDGEAAVREIISKAIGWSLDAFRRSPNSEKAFEYLRQQSERSGVYVLLIGNLGNHHTAFDVETFRGFALSDALAPFVVVNDQDAKPAWSFTLLHELAHIALGVSGVSGNRLEGDLEQFCNNVASTMLLPAAELHQLRIAGLDTAAAKLEIAAFALPRRVSRTLVTYRLFQAGMIDEALWRVLVDEYAADYRRNQEAAKAKANGNPDYYVVKRHRVGSGLLTLVRRSVESGVLTPTRAGKVLGVKPRNVLALLSGRAA